MSNEITLKKGEGKWVEFTVTRGEVPVDLSSATFAFAVKDNAEDAEYLLYKSGEFDSGEAASGELRLNLTSTETTALGEGNFVGALKIVLTPDQDVDLSDSIPITIESTVFHD